MPAAGYTKRKGRWTPEECLKAIRVWYEQYGDFPAATDWNPADAQRCAVISAERAQAWSRRVQRFYEGEYPWTGTIFKLFGGWNAFVSQAGFEPRPSRRSLLDVENPADVGRLADLAKRAEKAEGHERRAILHELASIALTLALDVEDGDES